MDSRIELRKKDFKKTFDDPRRRREEQQVQIRKTQREARLSNKRQAAIAGIESTDRSGGVDVLQLPSMVQAIFSNDAAAQLEASQMFRKLLSIECNPPIEDVIKTGVVPRLIEFLQNDNRPDLQFEAAWSITNIASGSQSQTQVVIQNGAIGVLIRLLKSPKDEVREQAVWALGNIAGDCADLRDTILKEGGLQPLIETTIASMEPMKLSLLRNGTWALSNLCRSKPRPHLETILPVLPILRDLIYLTDTDVLTDATWALSYITDGNDAHSGDAIEHVIRSGVCQRLVQLLTHPSYNVQTPALRCVGNIVSGNESQTQTMIVSGCVVPLRQLLNSPKKTIRKETCWTVSNITAGTKAQIQEIISEGLIPLIVNLANTTDFDVQREAFWALVNACSGSSQEQAVALVEAQVIGPLCNVLEVKNDARLVVSALEALDLLLSVGKQIQERDGLETNPYCTLVEEAKGFPKLEMLQYNQHGSKSYNFAMKLMTTYFSYDEVGGNESASYDTFTSGAAAAGGGFNFSDAMES